MKRIGAAISGTIVIAASLIGLYFGIAILNDRTPYSSPYAFVGVFVLVFVFPVVLCGALAVKPFLGVIRNKRNPAMNLILLRGVAFVCALLLIAVGCIGVVGGSWLPLSAGVVYLHFNWAIKDFHTSTDESGVVGK